MDSPIGLSRDDSMGSPIAYGMARGMSHRTDRMSHGVYHGVSIGDTMA